MKMKTGATKQFDVAVAITAAAAVAAMVVLFFFVQTLRVSIDRGAGLRATWQNQSLVQNKGTASQLELLAATR